MQNFKEFLANLTARGAQLVAVSKTQSPEAVRRLYDLGQRVFGENRVQELLPKRAALEAMGCTGIEWHLIGHLQRNKVRQIAPFVALIHSVDSLELLQTIDKEAQRAGRAQIDVLLQFHVAQEDTKFGLNWQKAAEICAQKNLLKSVRIVGAMGMATQTEDAQQIRREFEQLHSYWSELKRLFFFEEASFSILSMGMSSDYELALACGSNMLRIGSLLFRD